MKPVAERLDAARAELSAAERHIAELETRRRAALLADDAGAAALTDRKLIEARLSAQRFRDKIESLGQQTDDLPNDVEGTRALIASLEQRRRALAVRRRVDRSAADDAELDHLQIHIPWLQHRLQLFEGMNHS